MIRIGILTSEAVPLAVSPDSVRGAAARCFQRHGIAGRIVGISADRMRKIPECQLLINPLGRFYPEAGWTAIWDHFAQGGVILNLAPFAFTVPYVFEDGRVTEFPSTDRALHAIGLVDTFIPTGPVQKPARVHTTPRYAFIAELARRGVLPGMAEVCSMDVRVATRPARPDDLYASRGIVEARFEAACTLEDETGRPTHCPVARIDHFRMGSLVFANFTPADPAFFETNAGQEFLAGMTHSCLEDRVDLTVESRYARYTATESPEVRWQLRLLGPERRGSSTMPRDRRALHIDLFRHPNADRPVRTRQVEVREATSVSGKWRIPDLPQGRYSVSVTVVDGGRPVLREWTGFYLLSDKRIRRMLAGCAPLAARDDRVPDYMVREAKPYPLHGTTYMVRGLYRDCFQNVNVHLCDKDMRCLREAGINVLRTGIWTGYDKVFRQSGEFRQRSLRALDAYFLTAARYGLPVQFVFAAFVMNHWDRSKSPFHDSAMRRRIRRMFRQFMARFAGWPNVQVDLINEPSYAPYRDGFMWQVARPFGGSGERRAWIQWLKRTYGNVAALRRAWGTAASELRGWEDAEIPDLADFTTNYDGALYYDRRARIHDFVAFARQTFTEWTREIREIVKRADPRMPVMIGRDETLRIPSQQYEAYCGNLDVINWHQWHREGLMFVEYVLNRVRGMPCCGQEMGILPYKDQQNEERLTENDCHHMLERKLLYCLGNWIQWQSHSDLTMDIVKETKLGLIRADGTERPSMRLVRLLSWLEDRMASRLVGRREDLEDIVIVHPSSLYFSSDHRLAYQAAMQSILALHYHLNRRAVLVLEHLFRPDNKAQIGNPGLIVFPSPTILADETWQYLMHMVEAEGKTVLVSGQVDVDEHWRPAARLERLGVKAQLEKVATAEPIRIGDREFTLTFRNAAKLGLPGKAFGKPILNRRPDSRVEVFRLGKGRLIYCPLPVELADSIEPTVALYRKALKSASLNPPLFSVSPKDDSPAVLIYPVRYRDCVAYTIVNEGPEATVRFRDSFSGSPVSLTVGKERGAKVYIGAVGDLLGAYIHGRLRVGGQVIDATVDTAVARRGKSFQYAPIPQP